MFGTLGRMTAVQPIPDDEIAAELAASWVPGDPDEAPPGGWRTGGSTGVVVSRRAPPARRAGPDPGDLRRAAELVRPVALAHEHVLPLSPAFADLLPGGLPRGATVVVTGARTDPGVADGRPSPAPGGAVAGPDSTGATAGWGSTGSTAGSGSTGATAVALALAASASQAGSWVALVGLPALGLVAAAELGMALERLVVIEPPPAEHWGTVVGALVGAFDIVLLGAPGRVRPAEVRRLIARSRERGSVLVRLDGSAAAAAAGVGVGEGGRAVETTFAADLRVAVGTVGWEGLGVGHGLLRRRRVAVEVTGRRAAVRLRRAELWLPDDEGRVRPVHPGEQAGDHVPARRPRVRITRQPVPARAAGSAVRPGRGARAAPVPAAGEAWSDAG
jgi:hypothetical protein